MIWLAKLLHPTVLAIQDGKCLTAKGQFPPRTLRELNLILADFSIRRGSIAIDGQARCHFSSSIPPQAHQRLRNVIASRSI